MEDYRNPTLPPMQRAQSLLAEMTLEEKIGQMTQIAYNEVTAEEAMAWAQKGAGSFLHVVGDTARVLQKEACETRLGIPVLFGIDAVRGHALNPAATVFPTQLAAACGWNRTLVAEMGRATAREVAADGLHWTFSPLLCLARDTRWGRVNETFGEDPYLTGELAAAMIRGYQGEDWAAPDSILACAKHYIGYGEALGGRDSCDTEMTWRKLREAFLPPFKRAVEAGCATVMTAYGSIDGTPFTASEKALRQILKDELGFDGFVVTDWDNVQSLISYQRMTDSLQEASIIAVTAGNDMMMRTHAFYEAALAAARAGRLEEKLLDEAVLRILSVKFRCGLFESPEKKGTFSMGNAEHLALAEQLSDESIVLLENRADLLPLSAASLQSIAVIGPNADDIRAQYGDWTYFSHPDPNPEHVPARPYVTALEGIREAVLGARIEYHRGCDVTDPMGADIAGATRVAESCDMTVLVLGDVIDQVGEKKDRAMLELSGAQQALFTALRATGKPLVTVLVCSKPLAIPEIAAETDALVLALNGGMFGGRSVAKVLFGALNPAGHLPISFPQHSGQLPVYYNQLGGWHGGKYMDLDASPLYAFGYGLSYTQFTFGAPELRDGVLRCTVTNAGDRAGVCVPQLYFQDIVSTVMTPEKQLIAFDRLPLEPGESRAVDFPLDADMFSLVTADEQRRTEPGEFLLMVGPDSRDTSLSMVKIHIDDKGAIMPKD